MYVGNTLACLHAVSQHAALTQYQGMLTGHDSQRCRQLLGAQVDMSCVSLKLVCALSPLACVCYCGAVPVGDLQPVTPSADLISTTWLR